MWEGEEPNGYIAKQRSISEIAGQILKHAGDQAGDRVLAQDQDTGELAYQVVLRTTLRPSPPSFGFPQTPRSRTTSWNDLVTETLRDRQLTACKDCSTILESRIGKMLIEAFIRAMPKLSKVQSRETHRALLVSACLVENLA
jgi:hypothetical protein